MCVCIGHFRDFRRNAVRPRVSRAPKDGQPHACSRMRREQDRLMKRPLQAKNFRNSDMAEAPYSRTETKPLLGV